MNVKISLLSHRDYYPFQVQFFVKFQNGTYQETWTGVKPLIDKFMWMYEKGSELHGRAYQQLRKKGHRESSQKLEGIEIVRAYIYERNPMLPVPATEKMYDSKTHINKQSPTSKPADIAKEKTQFGQISKSKMRTGLKHYKSVLKGVRQARL